MNPYSLLITLTLVVAQLVVPRRLSLVPLLIGACHIPYQQGLDIGVHFTAVRLIIIAGLFRAVQQRALVWSSRQPLDLLTVVWAFCAILSSFGQPVSENYNPITVNGSLAIDYLGSYLLGRAYLRNENDLIRFGKYLTVALLPLAVLLLVEVANSYNAYSPLGTVITNAWVRSGHVRATGPFGIAILSGAVGAYSLPLVVMLYKHNRWLAIVGLVACIAIVYSGSSSGSMMTLAASLGALALWRWRAYMGWIKKGAILGLVGLQLVMHDPVWYIMGKIDLAGGSTGWHRAELITQAFNHFDEWWLVGTVHTRHWMPYGIEWSGEHSDITNQYLNMGVRGGFFLMLTYIAILYKAFQLLSRKMRVLYRRGDRAEFSLWCVGAAMFAHCVNFMGIEYFDQSKVFICLIIAAVPGLTAARTPSAAGLSESKRPDASSVQTQNGVETLAAVGQMNNG